MTPYVYQAGLWCEGCAVAIRVELGPVDFDGDSDQYPQGPYAQGGGEADGPQHGAGCRVFLENLLTTDGRKYVQEVVQQASLAATVRGTDCVALREWAPFYDLLPA